MKETIDKIKLDRDLDKCFKFLKECNFYPRGICAIMKFVDNSADIYISEIEKLLDIKYNSYIHNKLVKFFGYKGVIRIYETRYSLIGDTYKLIILEEYERDCRNQVE